MRPLLLIGTCLIAGAAAITAVRAQDWPAYQEQILDAPGRLAVDNYGWTVAVDDDRAVVSAYRSDVRGTNSGSLYVYRRIGQTWALDTLLTARNSFFDRLGTSLDLDEGFIIAGAPEDDDAVRDGGSVTVFKLEDGAWAFDDILLPGRVHEFATLGTAAAIDGPTIMAGAPGADNSSGLVYVFERQENGNWDRVQIIRNPGQQVRFFGTSLDVSGDLAAVSSFQAPVVFTFRRTNGVWEADQTITYGGFDESSGFGRNIAISGTTLFVTAGLEDGTEESEGVVSVYRHAAPSGPWQLATVLTDAAPKAFDRFGTSVHAAGDFVVVGADGGDGATRNTGSATLFRRSGADYEIVDRFVPSDGHIADLFGTSVGVDETGVVFVGAPESEVDGNDSGAGYAYVPITETYSESIAVRDEPRTGIVIGSVHPQPARTRILLDLTPLSSGRDRLEIFDMTGRRRMHVELILVAGRTQTLDLDISDLGPGAYLLAAVLRGSTPVVFIKQ